MRVAFQKGGKGVGEVFFIPFEFVINDGDYNLNSLFTPKGTV